MLSRGALGLAGLLSLTPGFLAAQGAAQAPATGGVTIDHAAVGCIVAGKFPRMNACFNPAAQVARARVYFRAEGAPYWYFVDMKSQAPCFEGILPKPKASIKKIDYYVEVVDKAFVEARTAEYDPDVVADKGACRKDTPAAPIASKASVAVGSVSGAPVVPAGFLSAGVVGAGGLSTTAVIAGVAGAGAATAGVVSTTGGGGGTTTTPGATVPTTTPATTQPPATTPSTTQPPAPSSNKPPVAVFNISPDPPAGLAPLIVKFSMCGSVDPDGDPLSYFFDFGDGTKTTGGCNTQHTYKTPSLKARSGSGPSASGSYPARMSVTDGQPGHERGQPYDVLVGCPTPKVNIVTPASPNIFSCPVAITATATDPTGIASVEFFAKDYFGTQSIGVDTSHPYGASFNTSQGGSFTLIAEATNQCGGVAQDSVNVFISCYGGRPSAPLARRMSWTSQLDVPGARGQVILNGGTASFPGAGRAMGLGDARKGENRIEAQLVAADGPGTWRFDFSNSPLLDAGSLRVLAGEVAELRADTVVFRLRGKVGERIAFTFRMNE